MTVNSGYPLNPMSTISFCQKRLNLTLANQEMAKHEADCLSLEKRGPYLEKARRGDYNDVLAGIWKDKTNRLEFVRSLSGELHAPIMFEAAILEFSANPTMQTIREISMPLLGAALFRAQQDKKCATYPSGSRNNELLRMMKVYHKSLQNRVEKELKNPNSALFNKYPSWQALVEDTRYDELINAKCDEKLLWTAKTSREIELPLPFWIYQHRQDAVRSSTIEQMKSKRDAFATRIENSLQATN